MTSSEESGSVIVRALSIWAAFFVRMIPFWLGLIVMFAMMELEFSEPHSYLGAVVTCFGIYAVVIGASRGPGRL